MKIEYAKEGLMNLFLKGRERLLSMGIILFTLSAALIVYRIQTKQIESLYVDKDTELKKNDALTEIGRSEKAVKLYKNLLGQKDASSVMNRLGVVAKESNVRLISIKPGREENQPLYIKTPFVLVMGADNYHAIGKFVSAIENEPGIYFVDAVNIMAQEKGRMLAQESTQGPKPTNKLIVNLIFSIIAFKD